MLLKLERVAFQPAGSKSRKLKPLSGDHWTLTEDAAFLQLQLRGEPAAYKLVLTFDVCLNGQLDYYRLGTSGAERIRELTPEKRSPISTLKRLNKQRPTWQSWLQNRSLWGVLIEGESTQLVSAKCSGALTTWAPRLDDKLELEVVFSSTSANASLKIEWEQLPKNAPKSRASGFVYRVPDTVPQTIDATTQALKLLPCTPDVVVLPGVFSSGTLTTAAQLFDELPGERFGLQFMPHLVRKANRADLPILTRKDNSPILRTLLGNAYCILDVTQVGAKEHITATAKTAKNMGFQQIILAHLKVLFELQKTNRLPNTYIDRLLKAVTPVLKKDMLYGLDLPPEHAIRYQLKNVHSPTLTTAAAAAKAKAAPPITAVLHDAIAWPLPQPGSINNSLSLLPKSDTMPLDDAAKYSYLLASILHSDWLVFSDPLEELQPAALQALPTLLPHTRPTIKRRLSDSQSELYEVSRNGLIYNLIFNFSRRPLTIQLPDTPCFDPTDMTWHGPNHELRVPIGDARVTLQIPGEWCIAGGSDHILPGCGVAHFEVDEEMEELSISLYDSVPAEAQLFVRIPSDIDGVLVNGLFVRSLKESGLNILRIDARNCPRTAHKIDAHLMA